MLSFEKSRLDEREAASIVAGLHSNIIDASFAAEAAGVVVSIASSPPPAAGANKRGVRDIIASDDVPEGGGGTGTDNANDEGGDARRSRKKPAPAIIIAPPPPPVKPSSKARKDPPMDATGLVFAQPELKPAPYFYYSDHSLEEDDDPLMPITSVGSVPTFPASEFSPFFSFLYCVISLFIILSFDGAVRVEMHSSPSHIAFAC